MGTISKLTKLSGQLGRIADLAERLDPDRLSKVLDTVARLAPLAEVAGKLLGKLPDGTLGRLADAIGEIDDGKIREALEYAFTWLTRRAEGEDGASGAAVPGHRAPLECVHASCWAGENAAHRHMNMLSPNMGDDKFDAYLAAMKERGCDTAHLLLMNRADGECAGYSIYGTGGTGAVHAETVNLMLSRLAAFRKAGFRIVLWGVADDSADWAKAMFANAAGYVADLRECGILDCADLFVLGLEMDEYGSAEGWNALAAALRAADPGLYLATHHTSGKYTYADLGTGVMGQLGKDCTNAQISAQIAAIRAKGKDAWGFEYARGPDRAKAEAALAAGAVGVGNW